MNCAREKKEASNPQNLRTYSFVSSKLENRVNYEGAVNEMNVKEKKAENLGGLSLFLPLFFLFFSKRNRAFFDSFFIFYPKEMKKKKKKQKKQRYRIRLEREAKL